MTLTARFALALHDAGLKAQSRDTYDAEPVDITPAVVLALLASLRVQIVPVEAPEGTLRAAHPEVDDEAA